MVATIRVCFLTSTLLLAAAAARADSVQLANGDVLHGHVLSLDDKQLRLESDVHGQLSVPRAKVATITLGDAKPPAPVPVPAKDANKALNLDDVLKQLQIGGVDKGSLEDVQKLFPLLATPAAGEFFNDKVQGLRKGTLWVQDIRRDAIRARDQVKDLTKDLGPDVEQALSPYIGVLERFIRETEPAAPQPAAPPQKK